MSVALLLLAAVGATDPHSLANPELARLERAAREFEDMEKMVEAVEGLYGPYVWGRWDVLVLPPSFPYGGMENPRLTFLTPTVIAGDKSLVSLLAHELAHSWSGNLVTNATWSDFWLNEGFTTYIENRIVEALYGAEVARMQALLGLRDLRARVADPKTKPDETVLYPDLRGRDPDESVGPIAYQKGASFLRVLEHHFGRAEFDAFLRRYFEAHRFESMTTPRFLERLRQELFEDEAQLWRELRVEEWVHGAGLPGNVVVPASARFERTRAAAEAFARDGALEGVGEGWLTAEWLDFLRQLPSELTFAQMQALDGRLGFSRSGNSEVLSAWLLHVASNAHEPSLALLEDFLRRQGRLKFLRPLYQAMVDNPRLGERARRLYARARPGYHPIATAALDPILRWSPD